MNRYFVPALLFAGTLFFGYLYINEPGQSAYSTYSQPDSGSVRYNQLQQLRQETAVKMDIESQQAQMAKRIQSPQLDPGKRKKNAFHKTELSSGTDPKTYDLEEASSYEAMTLDQRMDEFLAKKQQYEELEKSQKSAYVKAFVKEAYKMGFIVKVNSQMEIESVEKVANQ